MTGRRFPRASAIVLTLAVLSCQHEHEQPPQPAVPPQRPSILLVTLDTTRADAIGPEARDTETPAFNAVALEGRRYRQAYTAVPQTLPSHISMLTGLYPAGHGVHENARPAGEGKLWLAELLVKSGYHTAAFVSAFALAKRFGVARGFETFDDDFGSDRAERPSSETTDRALEWLRHRPDGPFFLWIHYYDPHYPYTPPEPFRSRYATRPYYGEVAAMDQQLGRLVEAFRHASSPSRAIVIAGDHGEGLGEHGEAQHGNLLYQATTHVPLLIAGPGVVRGTGNEPVSTRRIFDTILDWAGLPSANSLRNRGEEIVIAEAMKPYLDYGWQPQVMAVQGRQKTILAGAIEVYDVIADPGETQNLAASASPSRGARATLREYPVPSLQEAASSSSLGTEEQRKLASLGYVASTASPVIRADAPRPADMAALFPLLD